MAIQLQDRILTLCTTVGTNDAIIGATKEGYQGWEGITIGNTVYYCITDDTAWEVGYGQYLSRAGTPTIQRNVLDSNTGEKLDLSGNASIFCTYPSEKAVFLNADDNIYYPTSNITANNFVGKGNGITGINADANNLAPEAPIDGETYARNNKTWVSISESAGIPDAPVDGLQYGRQDGEWTEVESTDAYTKAESDVIDNAQDVKITVNNDEIARQQIEITNNSANITKNDGAINTNITNIASNTTAIGTLSGQVSQNSEDIAELQDSIFFTSAYSADYPASPNRDPENGNMYLQNVALFTYSYASATQIFCSKTDESGNVRQFTAVKPGDSIVLNEVDSPNYGRYELVSVEDVSDSYVVMNVKPKMGLGTVITGVKVAFQAFPKVGLWDENESNGYGTYPNNIEINGGVDVGSAANGILSNTMLGRNASGQNKSASAANNVSIGDNAFAKMSGAKDSVAVGFNAMKLMVSGSNNTAIGSRALSLNPNGKSNVAIGANAGSTLAGGDNNILIGDGAEPSATTVSNEVTLGNNDTTTVRMGNGDIVYPASGGGGSIWTEADGVATYDGAINVNKDTSGTYATFTGSSDGGRGLEFSSADVVAGATFYGASHKLNVKSGQGELTFSINDFEAMNINNVQEVSTVRDMTVNGVTVGKGSGSLASNVVLGSNVLENNSSGNYNTAVGNIALLINDSGSYNTGLGCSALQNNASGNSNTAVGYGSLGLATGNSNTGMGNGTGSTLTTGTNNLILGANANTSSPTVSNEVTIGDASVNKVRMGNGDVIYPASGNIWTESGGDTVTYSSTGNTTVLAEANSGKYATYQVDNADQKYSMQIRPDQANAFVIRNENTSQNLMTITTDGKVNIGGAGKAYEINTLAPTPTDNQTIALFSGQGIGTSQEDGGQYVAITRKGPIGSTTKNSCGGILFQAETFADANCGIRGTYEYTNGRNLQLFTSADNVTPPTVKMQIKGDGRVDITGSLYVNDTPVTTTVYVNEQLAIKDKVIDALSARLDELELKFKALK